MSTRSRIIYILVVLIFAFTSLAAGAFSAVQTAAHDLHQSDSAYYIDSSVGHPAYSIAGDCDGAPACSNGGG
jgi:hypothetical protein